MTVAGGLQLDGLVAGYGGSQVLHGLSLSVPQGLAVTLIGRNGMGKTTTIRAAMGMLTLSKGEVSFNGGRLTGCRPARVARAGIGLVPEGRHVFGSLSVDENLRVTARPGRWGQEFVYRLFPQLEERSRQSARTLSGGEQQMLATGRAIMTNPSLLIMDEATEGLAPAIRQEIWRSLAVMKQEGLSLLIIDRNLLEMASLVDFHNVIEKGAVVWRGTAASLAAEPGLLDRYLGV